MKTKICSRCQLEKTITEFTTKDRYKDNLLCWCKSCVKEYHKKHSKNYRYKHKDKLNEYMKIWRLMNIKKIKQQKRVWNVKNAEKVSEYGRLYRNLHKKEINSYYNKKRKMDVNYQIRCNLKNRIYEVIKGLSKSKSTSELLGCSIEKLKQHLESHFKSGMSWSNYGRNGWHIDHIRPCALFDLSKESEQCKCFHYTNLQPLWANENLKKGKKYKKDL